MGIHTTQIFSLETIPTEAVHPETSSSYFGSDRVGKSQQEFRYPCMNV